MREAIRGVEDENKKLTSHDAKASRLLTATLHVLILLLLNSGSASEATGEKICGPAIHWVQ